MTKALLIGACAALAVVAFAEISAVSYKTKQDFNSTECEVLQYVFNRVRTWDAEEGNSNPVRLGYSTKLLRPFRAEMFSTMFEDSKLSAEAVAAFEAGMRGPGTIRCPKDYQVSVDTVSRIEIWFSRIEDALQERYFNSFLIFSKPVFIADGDIAIVSVKVSCRGWCGGGLFLVLERTEDGWIPIAEASWVA